MKYLSFPQLFFFFFNPSLNSIVGKAPPCREQKGSHGEIQTAALPLSSSLVLGPSQPLFWALVQLSRLCSGRCSALEPLSRGGARACYSQAGPL